MITFPPRRNPVVSSGESIGEGVGGASNERYQNVTRLRARGAELGALSWRQTFSMGLIFSTFLPVTQDDSGKRDDPFRGDSPVTGVGYGHGPILCKWLPWQLGVTDQNSLQLYI